jgi:Mn2+/Fe2+ NRAMP family transporter
MDFLLVFLPCNALLVLAFAYRRFKWGEMAENLIRDYIAIVLWVMLVYFLVALCNFYRQKKNGVLKHLESKMVNTQLRLD